MHANAISGKTTMHQSALTYFNIALQQTNHNIAAIADYIGLNRNTVVRWYKNQRVPSHYLIDLSRLIGTPVPPTNIIKDQFYTKPATARLCYHHLKTTLSRLNIDSGRYHFIEPSAGAGCFYNILPKNRRTALDLDPQFKDAMAYDYLRWTPPTKGNYIVIGNPPFGLRGHVALQFINHSSAFADIVAFVLPQLFNSDGKGVPSKRVKEYSLAFSTTIDPHSFETKAGQDICIHTLFQVWTKVNTHFISIPPKQTCSHYIKVMSLSDGGTPASTRNKQWIGKCDLYIPSTCYTNMKVYFHFNQLPHKRGYGIKILHQKSAIINIFRNADLSRYAFYSTNSAVNIRKGLIEQILIDKGYIDGAG